MFTGYVSPVMRQKAKGSRPKRNAARRAARRLVLPGFPMKPRKFSKVEIDQYFSGDRIQCLVCGKTLRRLGGHLRIHSLTEDDYRELYGLPWRRGLVGTESFHLYSKAVKRRIEEGYMPPCNSENRAKAVAAIREHGFRTQPFMTEIRRENISRSNGKAVYPESKFEVILDRLQAGRTTPSVCADDDVPGITWFREQYRQCPAKKRRLIDVMNELPFPLQAAMRYLGRRFWDEVVIRRHRGESDHTIAAATGVSAMTINRGRHARQIQ